MQERIIRYIMGKSLDFAPETRDAYSNFGYCVLGRIIEKASGKTYEQYVKEQGLEPMGITDMYGGRTQLAHRAPGEAHYYQDDDGEAPSIFCDDATNVPNPYGAWCL